MSERRSPAAASPESVLARPGSSSSVGGRGRQELDACGRSERAAECTRARSKLEPFLDAAVSAET